PRIYRSMLFAEGLVAINWHGQPVPRLAESWEWDALGLTLRVNRRQGVRFHDGTPVTTEVVAAILRAGKFEGFEAVKAIEAHDARTILFHLSRPDGFLVNSLAGAQIVDEHKQDIATGPFTLVAKSPHLVAVRNTSYYRGVP